MKITPVTPDELDRLGDKVAPVVGEQISAVLRSVTRTWRRRTPSVDDLAAITPRWAAAVDESLMPAVADAFWRGVSGITDPLDAELDTVTAAAEPAPEPDPWGDPEIVGPGRRTPGTLRARSVHVTRVSNPAAIAYLSEAANRLKSTSNLIWEHARAEMLAGMSLGEGIDKLATRVARVSRTLAQPRAEVIARTEVNGAANAGALAQVRTLGVPGTKTWLAASDDRVRPSHAAASGQTVALTEQFQVGGASMDRPHDPGGPASQTVNCRCCLTYNIDQAQVAAPAPSADPNRIITAANAATDIPGIGDAVRYDLDQPLGSLAFELNGFPEGDKRIAQMLRFNEVIAQRFGVAFNKIEQISGSSTYAYIRYASGGRVLGLNPGIMTDSRVFIDMTRHWHPKQSGTILDLLAHEHGHYILMTQSWMPWARSGGESAALAYKRLMAAKQAAYKALVKAGGPRKQTDLAALVSDYAKTNINEMEAEMWSWYHMGAAFPGFRGDTRPTWLIKWGETLMRELGLDTTPLCVDLKMC